MTVKLIIRSGKLDGQAIRIPKPTKFLIGRGEDCQLRVSSNSMSRHHCELSIDESDVIVRDLGSRNGTFVNFEQIFEPHALESGDMIMAGELELEVQVQIDPAEPPQPANLVKKAVLAEKTALSEKTAPATVLDEDAAQWINTGNSGISMSDTHILSSQELQHLQRDLAGNAPRLPPPPPGNTRNLAAEALRRIKEKVPDRD